MKLNYVSDIENAFREQKRNLNFRGNGTIELQNVMFRCDRPYLFKAPNLDYIDAEIKWYETQDRSVQKLFDIYGKPVKIWEAAADDYGNVNSQYGYCVYHTSLVTGMSQYQAVLKELARDPLSRKAVMYYAPTYIHKTATDDGMNDHICTTSVQYFLNQGCNGRPYLDCQVNMRSNDAIFGYANDVAWQRHLLQKLSWDLLDRYDIDTCTGSITWVAGSLHVYERHYDLIDA